MDLRSLKHVVVLGKRLSFTKAAEELGLSQSVLSRSIQAIERQANVRLFDRDRGGVHLTAVGRALAERAGTLLRDADDLSQMLSGSASATQGEIAYGMGPLPAATLLPAVLSQNLTSNPDLRSHISVRSAEVLLSLLVADEIEFCLCAEGQLPTSAPVKGVAVGWFPISLIVRSDHPLLTRTARKTHQDFPLIVAAPQTHYRGAVAADRSPHLWRSPDVVIEDHRTLMKITVSSDAIWLSCSFAVADEIRDGRLKELPWPTGQSARRFRMMMYSLGRRTLSPAALKLRDQFRAHIRSLSESARVNA